MSQDSKRRLCKFTPGWCLFKEFSSWLVPVKYQSQKAYCILCKRVFSVSHSGLHDVKAHWKGKKHLQLQEQGLEKSADERLDRRDIKAYTLVFNEEVCLKSTLLEKVQNQPFSLDPVRFASIYSSLNPPSLRCFLHSFSPPSKKFYSIQIHHNLTMINLNTLEENHSPSYDFRSSQLRSQEKSINNSFGDDDNKDDNNKHFMNDDIIVENILTPTVTIESDPESSPPGSMSANDKDNMSLQIKSQVSAQQYCLRWKYHHSNLQVMFIQLLQRESFCDVTLACEGKMLRAHKVVLSACSTYFDKIFSEHEEKDPVVILKDVKFVDIKALVEFMYKGEINVENSHLTSLLKTAEELKIKGLADVSGKSIPKDDDEDSVTYGPSSLTLQSRDEEPNNEMKTDQMTDYDDMFTPTIVDGAPSVNDGSDNEDENMDKKDEEMEDTNDYMDSANEQSFSTLIAQLSDHPLQDYQNDENNERTSEHDNSETTANLALQFPDVIKMNDYLTTGRRQQFWEEPFTRRLMEAIKNKEIEMKVAAELMGVSYGTLYGRYRDAYGCLKHPYRTKEFWAEQGPADILAKLQKKEITLFRAAEMLNVTVTTLANYLTTLRYEKENENENENENEIEKDTDNEDEDEDMDVNDSMDAFESKPVSSTSKHKVNSNTNSMNADDDDDEDSRSSSTAIDRSDEDYP